MEFVSNRDELRTLYKEPSDGAVRKELKSLDFPCRGFLAKSPFVLIGSCDDKGNGDVTPKGDKPGFVVVLDNNTIAIPDRPGNNRLDTLENILVNPAVGLLFLIPGMNETLRINGEARITADNVLRERLAVDGRPPISVIVVTVKSAYMHCAKAFMRSELWKPDTWVDRATLPTLGTILKDQLALADSAAKTDEWLDDVYKQSMW
ncbi:pyridoxamine 5'-phosphate oxidase family protein [Rhizobiaceae sp. 2RAB30]